MDDRAARRRITAEWIRGLVDGRTLKDAASDITSVTGWPIDHSRLSRYANPDGATHIGALVVKRLSEYAAKRGLPPLDLTPPGAVLSLEERAVLAAEAQASAIADLAAELRLWRTEDRARLTGQEHLMTGVLASLAQLDAAPAAPRAPLAPGQ